VKARSVEDLPIDLSTYQWTEMRRIPLPWRNGTVLRQSTSILGSDSLIDSLVSQIHADSVRMFIQQLQDFGTRYCLAANRDSVALWIQSRFFSMGFSDVQLDSFQYGSTMQKNVIATLPGSTKPAQIIVIGGHHDSYASGNPLVFAPGADDNASGTAAVLEIARVLRQTGYHPKSTIKFATFAAEERGLLGSAALASRLRQAGASISLMINHDMISYTSAAPSQRSVDINYYSGFEYLRDAASSMVISFTDLNSRAGDLNSSGSDSYSFWANGFPAVYFAESQFSPFYHSSQDVITNYTMEYCAEIIRASCALAATYSDMPARVLDVAVADMGDGSSLRVYWAKNSELDLSGYRIYVGKASARYDTSFVTTDTSFVVGNLTDGIQYVIGVAAFDTYGSEGLTTERTGTPHLTPLTPSGFVAEPLWKSILLRWHPSKEADLSGYTVYRSTSLSDPPNALNAVPIHDTVLVENTAQDGIYYYYSVTAVDSTLHESTPTPFLRSRVVSLNKGILLVNETKGGDGSPMNPTIAQINDFYHLLLREFTTEDFNAEVEGGATLADIGAYSTVIWHGDDASSVAAARNSIQQIAKYLAYGGKLFITSYRPTSAFGANISTRDFLPGEFVYDYLKIRRAENRFATRFSGALPFTNGYPQISVDTSKTLSSLNYHLSTIEAIEAASGATDIYSYDSEYDTTTLGGKLRGQPVGIEYLGSPHKAITLSFPLYYMHFNEAQSLVNLVLTDKFAEATAVEDHTPRIPEDLTLFQNYPNPFNPVTTIEFRTPRAQFVTLKVYDILGNEVSTLVNETLPAGVHRAVIESTNFATGVYFYRLVSGSSMQTKKMIVLK